MVRGVVERVNWSKGLNWTDLSVDVALVGGPVVEAVYLTDWPPPPRSVVMVETTGPGAWVVLGVEGGVRNVFHDDFMGGNATTFGDTPWTQITGTGTTGFTAGTAMGVARMTTLASTGDKVGWQKPGRFGWDSDQPALFTARIRVNTAAAFRVAAGISDDDPIDSPSVATDGAYIITSNAVDDWRFNAIQSGSIIADTATGVDYFADTFYVVEILVKAGEMALCWIDGRGPFVLSGVLDATTTNPSVFLSVNTSTNTAVSLFVDFARLDRPGSLVLPADAAAFLVDSDAAVEFTADDADAITAVTNDDDVETIADPNDAAVGDPT